MEKSYLYFVFSRITKEEIHGWKENDFAGLFFVRIKTMDKFIVRALMNDRSQICGAGRSHFLFRAALMLCIFYAPQQALCRIFCVLLFLVYTFMHNKQAIDLCR